MSKKIVLLKLVIIFLVQSINSAKYDDKYCYHERTNNPGVCVEIKNCESARNDIKSYIFPELCRFDKYLPIVCCPFERKRNGRNIEDIDTGKCYHSKTRTDGVCISIQNCKMAQQELEMNQVPQICKLEGGLPVVCCPKQFGVNQLGLSSQIGSVAEQKCKEYSAISQELPFDAGPRIVGGEEALPGEFPHLAVLGYGEEPEFDWRCGGSLISENFVLTAAHCLPDDDPVKVIQLGDVVLTNTTQTKRYRIKNYYKHPDYVSTTSYNDIGLIELYDTVEFTPTIKPACLPKNAENDNRQKLIVTGFGTTSVTSSEISQTLQKVAVNYFPNSQCDPKYRRDTSKFPNGVLDPLQLCYGGKTFGKDACQGDSGGPLQFFDYDYSLYQVIGVVSLGIGCGNPKIPGIYTRVSYYISWIENLVWGQKNIGQKEKVVPRGPFSIHRHIHNVAVFG